MELVMGLSLWVGISILILDLNQTNSAGSTHGPGTRASKRLRRLSGGREDTANCFTASSLSLINYVCQVHAAS